jgi:hypothetical protein
MDVTALEHCAYIEIVILRERNARECHSEIVEAVGNNALLSRTSPLQYGYFDVGTLL